MFCKYWFSTKCFEYINLISVHIVCLCWTSWYDKNLWRKFNVPTIGTVSLSNGSKIYAFQRGLFPTGQTGQVPGPLVEWGPQINFPLNLKNIHCFANFLKRAVTLCSTPTNFAIIFWAMTVTLCHIYRNSLISFIRIFGLMRAGMFRSLVRWKIMAKIVGDAVRGNSRKLVS